MESLDNIDVLLEGIEESSGDLSTLESSQETFDTLVYSSLGIPNHLQLSGGKLDQSFFDTHSTRVGHQVVVHDLADYSSSEDVRRAFVRYLKYSKRTWVDLRLRGGTAQILSHRDYVDKYAKAGFKLIEVQGVVNLGDKDTIEHGLSYGLIATDRNSIQDLNDFPESIRRVKNIIRLHEVINVSTVGNFNYPSGALMDLVFDEIFKIADEQIRDGEEEPIIITRIVSGERFEGSNEDTNRFTYVWSQKALNKRNFTPEGDIRFDVTLDTHPSIKGIPEPLKFTLIDGVYVWKRSNNTKAKVLADAKKAEIKSYILDQILCTGSFPVGARIACFSDSFSNNLDYALAEKHKSSGVVAVHFSKQDTDTYRQNLEHVVATQDGVITKRSSLDAVFSNNVLRTAALNGKGDTWKSAANYLYNQVSQLRDNGHYTAREVLVPGNWPSDSIELNNDSARKFRKYCNGVGLKYTELSKNRFRVPKEEQIKYTYLVHPYPAEDDYEKLKSLPAPFFTPQQYHKLLRRLDIRIDNAKPIYTPYVQDKFVDGFDIKFYDIDGNKLDNPPNQYELIGRKVSIDSPIAVRPKEIRDIENPKYIKSRYYRAKDGEVRQLISRKGRNVIALCPVIYINGEPSVPIREAYPRGIPLAFFGTNSDEVDLSLDGTVRSGYHMESIAISLDDYSEDELYEAIVLGLKKYAMLRDEDIPAKEELLASLSGISIPSASSIDEIWRKVSFELNNIDYTQVIEKEANSFSNTSLIRPIPLKDIVGIGDSAGPVSNALLQFAYEFYINNSLPLPKWNGTSIALKNHEIDLLVHDVKDLHHGELESGGRDWKKTDDADTDNDFYQLKEIDFIQVDGKGNQVGEVETLEAATLSKRSKLTNNTYVICPVAMVNGKSVIYLETRDDLPLVFEELNLVKPEVVPAYRVRIDTAQKGKKGIDLDLISCFEKEHGVSVVRKNGAPVVHSLSPELLVAPGIIPERAVLKLVEIDPSSVKGKNLRPYYTEDLVKNSSKLFGGHTKNGTFRVWHSLS